jgi:hypothetical protein
MRIFRLLTILAVFVVAMPNISHAQAKPWVWGWWPSHWKGLDFKPYLGDSQLTQRGIWDRDTWTPEAWIKDAGDEKRIMRDLYAVDILSDQYTNGDDIPVLVVGQNYMRLSGLDQRRILQFVDYVFKITSSEENGMFFVYYRENKSKEIGVYDKNGFQEN